METAKDYLANKVTPLMEPLMVELLTQKPEDPVDFMLNWLSDLAENSDSKPLA